jgi:restriction endonuclease S subunit
MSSESTATRTGGRPATGAVIRGRYALSVGYPEAEPPIEGWEWTALSDVAQLESGHTPSRRRPDWWGGDVPWIGIKDATQNHGRVIGDTIQHTNEEGIAHSSARVLPAQTVCLSRTASVGYVVVMGQPMATSQDFVNWVCDPERLDWRFLRWVLVAEKESFLRFASGTTHQTIYFPEAKAFHVCLPPLEEQRRIADVLGAFEAKIEVNLALAERLNAAAQLLFDNAVRHAGSNWKCVRVDEVAAINAKSHSSKSHPAEVNYLDIASTATRRIDRLERLAWEEAPSRARRVITPGDTLISTVRPERRSFVFVPEMAQPITASTGFAVVSPVDVDAAFLYRSVTSDRAINHYSASAGGSAYPAVNAGVIAAWEFPMPLDSGSDYGALAGPLEAQRWAVLEENETLAAVRNALLPKLVSGTLRVSENYLAHVAEQLSV